ncbi:MAG TPA: MFS transporter [Anaerolineales bacterium]|nr:MFS transporter [Anaerolineales bacterium]
MLYSQAMNVLRSLKHRPFALLWAGQTTSRLGDSLYRIALAWWVLEKTGSAVAMGTVLVFSQIPLLLFLLIGGVVVDRLPRIRIMFVSDILSGLVITFVAVFSWLELLEIWHIYIASMLFGFVEAFFFPAYQAVIPQITPSELLTSANSLNGLSQRVTGIVGPALGAALVAVGGTSLTFALDGLSFFISALCILPLLHSNLDKIQRHAETVEPADRPGPARQRTKGSLKAAFTRGRADLRAGFELVMTVPWIWITILIFGFVNITEASPRAVAMPFLIKNDLGADVELLGIFGSAASLGFVVGMVWLGQYVRLRRRGLLGYLSVIVTGIVLLPFAFKLPALVLVASMFIGGLSMSVFSLIWTHTLQEMVPAEVLGRVYSIDALGSFVLLPVGFSLAGWATDRFGAPAVFLIGAIGTIVLASLGLFHPAIRNLD